MDDGLTLWKERDDPLRHIGRAVRSSGLARERADGAPLRS